MSHSSSVPLLNDEHHDDRLALREMLREVGAAINGKDWDRLRGYLDPNVLVTFIDQTMVQGVDALNEYVTSKLGRFSSILSDMQVDPVPDAPAMFYGDTALCPISSADRFVFRNGREFLVQARYTATVVKRDGSWKLVALHGGVNAFNNPISSQVQNLLYGGIATAGIGGLILGWLASRRS